MGWGGWVVLVAWEKCKSTPLQTHAMVPPACLTEQASKHGSPWPWPTMMATEIPYLPHAHTTPS